MFFTKRALFKASVGLVAFQLVSATGMAAVLDLATVSPGDGRVLWIYGSSGQGDQGVPVAGGPDVDGDGFADYAVAYFKANPFARNLAGEVALVFGDGTLNGFVDTSFTDPNVLYIAGAGVRETAGSEIWMDDITGDGLGDLMIARQNFSPDSERPGAGALTIVVGGSALRNRAGTLATVDLAAPPAELTLITVIGAQALDRLGIWVRAGDVSGDGIADVVVGADQEDAAGEQNRGAVYLLRGGAHLAASTTIDLRDFGSTALAGHVARITPPPGAAGYHFGATCQVADLDGNGRGEVLAAATLARGGASILADGAPAGSAESLGGAPHGVLYIAWDDHFPDGLWPAGHTVDLAASPARRTVIRGGRHNHSFGEEILGDGDYDHDGRADLFVGDLLGAGAGDLLTDGTAQDSGRGHVLYGAADLKGRDLDLDDLPADLRHTTILGPGARALGSDSAAHGDFDGDGIDDLVITAPHAAPQGRDSAGAFHVLYGQIGGWPAQIDTHPDRRPSPSTVRLAEVQGAAGTSGSDLGDTVGYSAAAADLNADGRTDVITNEMVGNGLTPGTVDVGNMIVVSGAALPAGELACPGGSEVLCLGQGRFLVQVRWRDFQGGTGSGQVVPVTSKDSGLFWFFDADNWELLVKVLDGCAINGRFWVFSAATTNVEFTLRITDTTSGTSKEYLNPLGVSAPAVTDTDAFSSCP